MDFFFNPSSVAVIGASERGIGSSLLYNLTHGSEVKVYPVNPGYEELFGHTCYGSAADIPGPVDLAVALVPAPAMPQVLEDCGAKGVPGVMIQSAGFSETGAAGHAIQEQCLAIAAKTGMRLWGPNCMGLVDVKGRKFFTFMYPPITKSLLPHGRVSLVVQSGMLSAGFLAELSTRRQISVAKACSIGNKCDVDECDILGVLLDDPDTKAIAMYLESMPRGRLFIELAEQGGKPIAALKVGQSASGAKAALSHTASLAGDSRLARSLLEAAGAELCYDFHHLIDKARTLALYPGLPRDCRTAILTFSGGAGILSCDLLEEQGLKVAQLSPRTKQALAAIFPDWMPPENPVDLWPAQAKAGRLPVYMDAARAVMADPGVDLLLFHYFMGVEEEELDLQALKEMADEAGKSLAFWGLGFGDAAPEFEKESLRLGVPVYSELARAVDCLGAAARCKAGFKPKLRPGPSRVSLPQGLPGPGVWDEYDSKRLLDEWNIPVVDEAVVGSADQALTAAEHLGYPVVLKGLKPGVVHKSEQGLVAAGISGPAALEKEAAAMLKRLDGQGRLLLQKHLAPDYELIVGLMRDGQFGPCVMLGRGGFFSELEPDVAFELAPLDAGRALRLMGRIRAGKLFDGFRGQQPLDRKALADLIVALADLGASHECIEQMDLNPVAIVQGKPVVLDATVVMKQEIIQ